MRGMCFDVPMMHSVTKTLPRQLIVLFCAVLLLCAQQAAFVHLLGHFSAAPAAVAQQGEADDHGSAAGLAHECTTCLAFTALAAAAPLLAQAPALLSVLAQTLPSTEIFRVSFPSFLPYAARAPPLTL